MNTRQLHLFDPSTEVIHGFTPRISPTQTVGGSSLFKTCSKCKEIKLRSGFNKSKTSSDGLRYSCKVCRNKIHEKHRNANRDKIRKASSEWKKANPEKSREILYNWRINNPEKYRAIMAKYRNSNKEKYSAYGKKWRKSNLKKVCALAGKHRALKLNAPGYDYTKDHHIADRWELYGGKCWMCGQPAKHTDHVIPLCVGGPHWPSNLRPACAKCNKSRPKDGSDLPTRKKA